MFFALIAASFTAVIDFFIQVRSCGCTVTGKDPVSKRVNSAVELTCTAHDDFTNYTVTWYKDGREIVHGGDGKYETAQTGAGSVLTVRRVREHDVGEYQCAVTLGAGPARKTLKHVVNLFCAYYMSSDSMEAVFLESSSYQPREDVTRMLRGKRSRGI